MSENTLARRGQRSLTTFDCVEVKQAMQAAGITQDALGRALGVARPNITALLSGHVTHVRRSRRDRLQDALHQLALENAAKKRAEADAAEAVAAAWATRTSESAGETTRETAMETSATDKGAKEATPQPRIRRL